MILCALVRSLEELEKLIIAFSVSFIGLLLILDRLWGGYMSPMEHVAFILNYTKALVTPYPTGIMSYPWQWLLNQVQIPYLKVDVNQMVNGQVVGSFSSVYFNGAMNPLIIFLTIPSMLYATYLFIKRRDDLSLLVIVWFTATYFPFIPMAIFWHRVMYLFYFINTLPAVCIAVAVMVLDARPPKIVLMLYLLAVVRMFVMMFPFRTIP